jgi:hypothetical protein
VDVSVDDPDGHADVQVDVDGIRRVDDFSRGL